MYNESMYFKTFIHHEPFICIMLENQNCLKFIIIFVINVPKYLNDEVHLLGNTITGHHLNS
jgi:hypothetical protein